MVSVCKDLDEKVIKQGEAVVVWSDGLLLWWEKGEIESFGNEQMLSGFYRKSCVWKVGSHTLERGNFESPLYFSHS